MMSSSFLKATAVATMAAVSVLAATAEAAVGSYHIQTPAITPGFLLSPIFLWVAANVIIVWLVSSSRRRGSRAADDDDAAAAHEVVVPGAVDDFYASEYEASFSDAAAPRADGAPPVSSKRLTREARAAARRSERPRVSKKLEPAARDVATAATPLATTVVAEGGQRDEPPRDERRRRGGQEGTAAPPPVTVPAAVDDDEEDVSMDSLWASIVQRRAARPVVVQKSESWGNEELPRLQRVAETAAARRQVVRKSVSAVAKAAAAPTTTQPPPPEPAAAARQTGWRTRDVLVSISPDELLRRAESFIRRQREHLRLQRQESEQRQLLLLQRRLHAPAAPAPLIRV